MNIWTGMGRLTKDPEFSQTQNGVAVCKFTLAVDKEYQKKDEERKANFISCVAWRNNAEFISKYFSKGAMMGVFGEIETRTYDDKEGVKRYVTEVIVNKAYFAGSKGNGTQRGQQKELTPADFEDVSGDDDLPF